MGHHEKRSIWDRLTGEHHKERREEHHEPRREEHHDEYHRRDHH